MKTAKVKGIYWNPSYLSMALFGIGNIAKVAAVAIIGFLIYQYRDKLAGAGSGVGEALGNIIGGVPRGIATGVFQQASLAGQQTREFVESFSPANWFGGGGGSGGDQESQQKYYDCTTGTCKELTESQWRTFQNNLGGSENTYDNKTITPNNRDYSDVTYVKPANLAQKLQETVNLTNLYSQSLGHAGAARAAIETTGFNPAAQFKAYLAAERARGNTQSVSELYGYWRR